MKTIIFKLLLCIAVFGVSQSVSAQFSLKSLTKAVTSDSSQSTESTEATDTMKNKINVADIPSYTCQKVYETDEQGNRLKNEDGTDKYKVQLVDKNGNVVSPEAAEAQVKKINSAILTIAAKVGLGAAMGGLSGKKNGVLYGLAAGIGLSVTDIINVVKLKKDSNKQKKALELYKKSFDEEGNPLTATVDSKTLKELNISEDNAVSKTTAQIEKEISAGTYKEIPSNESLDALLDAASKVS